MTQPTKEQSIIFAAIATNGDKENAAVPQSIINAFMASITKEERTALLSRHDGDQEAIQDDLHYLAAKWKMQQYAIDEAQKLGYQPDGSFIGLEYLIAIERATGLEAGLALAQKYEFNEGYTSIEGHGVAPSSYLFIHEHRQVGDAILFIGSNEKASGNDVYTVGIVYAPVALMEKYGRGRRLPGY